MVAGSGGGGPAAVFVAIAGSQGRERVDVAVRSVGVGVYASALEDYFAFTRPYSRTVFDNCGSITTSIHSFALSVLPTRLGL